MTGEILLMGVGKIFYGDEGVGVRLVERLELVVLAELEAVGIEPLTEVTYA